MRTLLVLSSVALMLEATGCAGGKSNRVRNRSEVASEAALSSEPNAQADISCARGVRKDIKRFCTDAPSELGEGYAERARQEWKDATRRCDGLRGKMALRAFDACIVELEANPNQIDDDTRARREAVAPKIAEARADPVFDKLFRKKRMMQDDADAAAEAFKDAVKNQDADGIRFRREEWAEAQRVLEVSEKELSEYLDKIEIDPRDRRALGVW